jgi:hypothetical protein
LNIEDDVDERVLVIFVDDGEERVWSYAYIVLAKCMIEKADTTYQAP